MTEPSTQLRVGHSLPPLDFAPFFGAIQLRLFEDVGVEVETIFDSDRQRPINMLLDGQLDVLLTGPLRTFDLEARGVKPQGASLVVLNHRVPFYLMSPEPTESLELEDLVGKRIILYGGSPPPNLLLRHLVRMAGIGMDSIHWIEGISGNDQIRALEDGTGDLAMLSQPEVETLLEGGRGHIAMSLPELFGPLNFSTVVAPRSFIDSRPEMAELVVDVVQKAKEWMISHSADEVTAAFEPVASDLPPTILRRIVARALVEQYWVGEPGISRWHYEWLKEAYCTESDRLKPVSYAAGVEDRFAHRLRNKNLELLT